MLNRFQILQYLIAFLTSDVHATKRFVKILKTESNQDRVIYLASKYLLLPALYHQLLLKQTLGSFSLQKQLYLEHLVQINANRNKVLLEDAKHIHKLLEKHKIPYVFLKGIALLGWQPNGDKTQMFTRMVGDIDLLVPNAFAHKIYTLFIAKGFKSVSNNPLIKFQSHRHLPRLKHPNFLGAVEIHLNPFRIETSLPATQLLKKRILIPEMFWIPDPVHMHAHAIYSSTINDRGFQKHKITFKNILDVLYLQHNIKQHIEISNDKYFPHFFFLTRLYTGVFKHLIIKPSRQLKFRKLLAYSLMSCTPIAKKMYLFYKYLSILKLCITQLNLLFMQSAYRQVVYKNKGQIGTYLWRKTFLKKV